MLIRFIALADIYGEFCNMAFDEIHEPDYASWAQELGLNVFRVGQCVGPEFERDEEDDYGLLNSAVGHIARKAKPAIYEALKSEFGDDSLLFVSLWSTADYDNDESGKRKADAEIDWAEESYWILNTELTGEKQRAFNWVCQGFCS